MTPVTPIEPHLRRRDGARRPSRVERGDRAVERTVPIPVHREPQRAEPVEPMEPDIEGRLSERALAARFFPVVAAVVAADLATKAWATSALATRAVRLVDGVALALHYNRASAGGVSLGAHTRDLNFLGTGIVVALMVMIVPSLTRLHRRAWVAAALIVGAGLGNMASLVSDDRGVADFIAFSHGNGAAWVLNVADVALAVGLALLAWTTLVLARAARREAAHARVR